MVARATKEAASRSSRTRADIAQDTDIARTFFADRRSVDIDVGSSEFGERVEAAGDAVIEARAHAQHMTSHHAWPVGAVQCRACPASSCRRIAPSPISVEVIGSLSDRPARAADGSPELTTRRRCRHCAGEHLDSRLHLVEVGPGLAGRRCGGAPSGGGV